LGVKRFGMRPGCFGIPFDRVGIRCLGWNDESVVRTALGVGVL